jgi:hypothetical protein
MIILAPDSGNTANRKKTDSVHFAYLSETEKEILNLCWVPEPVSADHPAVNFLFFIILLFSYDFLNVKFT